MKKWTYHHTFALCCGLCLALIGTVQGMKLCGIYLWLLGISTRRWTFFLLCALASLLFGWLACCRFRKCGDSRKWRIRWAMATVLFLLVFWQTQRIVLTDDCHVFVSPDGTHTIVVQRTYPIHYANCLLFEMTSPCTMKVIEGFAGDVYPEEPRILAWYEDHFDYYIAGQEGSGYYLED